MLALAIVFLVTTLMGNVSISLNSSQALKFTEESRDMRYATHVVKTSGSSWSFLGPFLSIAVPGPVADDAYYDVTINFSGEFLIFAKSDTAPLAPESIEVRIKIWQAYLDYEPYPPAPVWSFFDYAKPWKVVMLTEQPDTTGKNWESRAFTFIYKGLPGSGKGDIGYWEPVGVFKFVIWWRLYPASSTFHEAQARLRSLVVTINPSTSEPDWQIW